MSPLPDWPATVAWVAALLLLALGAWQAECSRPIQGRQQATTPHRRSDADDVFGIIDMHLIAWAYGAAGVWLVASGAERFPLRWLGGLAAWFLPISLIPALIAVFIGRALGTARGFPGRLRWALSPFRGLAMLLIWVRTAIAVLRERRRSVDRTGAAPLQAGEVSAEQGVLDLASLTLEEIMIPRSQVVALEGARTLREAIRETGRAPHALYPVYGESVDQPLGVVWILDLALPGAADRPVREFARPARIVPETMRGLNLLRELCGAEIPATLVVDEFGGMAGLVTVEDLVEVLVGDLAGEHEVIRHRIVSLPDGAWRVEGTTAVEEFNRRFGPLLPEGEYETVAGLFLERAGRIPQVGDEVELPGVVLEVLDRTERRILWLSARILEESAPSPISAPPPRGPQARRE